MVGGEDESYFQSPQQRMLKRGWPPVSKRSREGLRIAQALATPSLVKRSPTWKFDFDPAWFKAVNEAWRVSG